MALDLLLFNLPQVLYAILAEFKVCPPSKFNFIGPNISFLLFIFFLLIFLSFKYFSL